MHSIIPDIDILSEGELDMHDRFWFNIRYHGFDNDNPLCGHVQDGVENKLTKPVRMRIFEPIWEAMMDYE